MNNTEIMRLIDRGANFYCRQLGNAAHMEFRRLEHFSMINPKPGEPGGTSIFDVDLENLNDRDAAAVIREIKALNVHTWWGLCSSERIHRLIFGAPSPNLSAEEHENDEETYMALFPDEKPAYPQVQENGIGVTKVETRDEFTRWADICNAVLHDNYPILHPKNHYEICREGILRCYLASYHGEPAGTAAILVNAGMDSLEFVATLPRFRKLSVAWAVCQTAVDAAFRDGAEVITVRAFREAKNLYKTIGFKVYF